jgi:hypothetical protein
MNLDITKHLRRVGSKVDIFRNCSTFWTSTYNLYFDLRIWEIELVQSRNQIRGMCRARYFVAWVMLGLYTLGLGFFWARKAATSCDKLRKAATSCEKLRQIRAPVRIFYFGRRQLESISHFWSRFYVYIEWTAQDDKMLLHKNTMLQKLAGQFLTQDRHILFCQI